MSLAYNSDPPFSTATKTRPGKTFLLSSPFSKIYPPLNFSPLLSLSFLSSRPQCFPCARKSQCFEHSYLALLKRFAVSNISRDITAVLWTLPPSQLETERNHSPGVTKERGKSWICKGEGGREGDARVDGWKGRVSSSDIYAPFCRRLTDQKSGFDPNISYVKIRYEVERCSKKRNKEKNCLKLYDWIYLILFF